MLKKAAKLITNHLNHGYRIIIEMHSTDNEGKFVVEKFIITLRDKIYKYVTSLSKKEYINKLNDIPGVPKKNLHNLNLYKLTLHHAIWKIFSQYKNHHLETFAKFWSDITTLSVFIEIWIYQVK